MRRRRSVLTIVAAAALAVTAAGCSPSNPEANEAAGITEERANDPRIPTGPGSAISLEAFDLGFRNLEGVAIDGAVAVTLTNVGDAEHNIRIDEAAIEADAEDEGRSTGKVTAVGGETSEGELLLFGSPAGTEYQFYCDIPGHRAAGMEGTLIVYLTEADAAGQPNGSTDMGA